MERARQRGERARLAAVAAAVMALHVAGLTLLLAVVAPAHLELSDGTVFGVGLGLAAYALGVRHAFDADHVAAIDTATRKLMSQGRPTATAGFFFSLGHSTVVVVLAVLLAIGVRGIGEAVADEGSALHAITGIAGPAVSGLFLLALGLANLGLASRIGRAAGRGAGGAELDRLLASGGLLARLWGRATRGVRSAPRMYPVGLLFGLGFDTATEVALLASAGAAAAGGLPLYAVLCLPLLFAAGMTLFDAINGAFVTRAYGWALGRPMRRAYYNLAVTAMSAIAALAIAAIELSGVLADALGLEGGPIGAISAIDLADAGFALAGSFVVVWGAAALIWRFRGVQAA